MPSRTDKPAYLVPPASEAEFHAAMQSIDELMQREGVPIHGRGLRAGLEYARRHGLTLKFARTGQSGTPGNYSDQYADAHIRDWIDARYGDRQNISWGPGKVVVLLRGDPWALRLPLIYGSVRLVVERDLDRYSSEPAVSTGGPLPIVNILPLIEGLPKALAAQLTNTECQEIFRIFRLSLDNMRAIERLKGQPFAPEIQSDITAALTHMLSVPPHFGQSKWASCQAAEKAIKCLLKVRNAEFPWSHRLQSLAALAETQGVQLDATAIAHASVPAGVRYGEMVVGLEEAFNAHHASLLIGQQVSTALAPGA